MEMKDLTREQLLELRKQVVLNSLYISDYENSFGIDPNKVCLFFDSYMEYLNELLDESGYEYKANNYFDEIFKLDNDDNLIDYFNSIEWEI